MTDEVGTPQHDETSGTAVRGPRPLMERMMVFNLGDELARLKEEPIWMDGDRNSLTLAKEEDFRVLLTALKPGAAVNEKDGDGRLTVHLLEGQVTLRLGQESAELSGGEVAAIDAGTPWNIEARSEAALLLTMTWPPRPPDPRDPAGSRDS